MINRRGFVMIYFDNSATTQALPEVVDTYSKVSAKIWGNPSSLHNFGDQSFNLLEQSRKQIADLLKVNPDEIYFTSEEPKAITGLLKELQWKNELTVNI